MAIINELIDQIEDKSLRDRIASEVNKLTKQKKFGLVFEEHLPECTPLWDIPVRKGLKVARKSGPVNEFYTVTEVRDGVASCQSKDKSGIIEFSLDDLVCIAEFGEPIYPYLKPMDAVCNNPSSDLWHTLIEADNYHALQLLDYLYAGKVDCIYIDPPYNTGARDWKYNNDYVDNNDQYRHSKWLSMMQKLLNPNDSVLIITIDEKEYLHLGCLLDELFPDASIQMISSVINPAGVSRGVNFARTDEYIFYVQLGKAAVQRLPLGDEWRLNAEDKRTTRMLWSMLIRTGTHVLREDSKNQFYPIFVYEDGSRIHSVGEPFFGVDRSTVVAPEGTVAVWPIRSNGDEGNWQVSAENLRGLIKRGFVKLGRFSDRGMAISYLKKGEIKKVETGVYEISGYRQDGSVISNTEVRSIIPGTQWRIASHDASRHGTNLLTSVLGEKRFSYPKSLYAVHDALMFVVANKKDALIVDFFAGSGTTLHAVNLLNAEDGGRRRCILVTNNEISETERRDFEARGVKEGSEEWENKGIARYVTWPRTVCSIEGRDVNGNQLRGNYIGSGIPMSEGFKANAAFFKLSFLEKNAVALGRQFKEMLPTLWMKAGAHGRCPVSISEPSQMMIAPENHFAVLLDEKYYMEFVEKVDENPQIETVFIVTDSETGYLDMLSGLNVREGYQLYRDYLDNFRINLSRR